MITTSGVELIPPWVNPLRPRQNGRHSADDTLNRIFVNENVRISIEISLKFVPGGPINNIPSLVQIMAWRRPGDKPLSESMMVSLLTHICVTRPQWVNKCEQRNDVWSMNWSIYVIFLLAAYTTTCESMPLIAYTVCAKQHIAHFSRYSKRPIHWFNPASCVLDATQKLQETLQLSI